MPTELADEADAYRFLESLRWPDGVPNRCPQCGSDRGAWFLTPTDGHTRPTSTGARSARRLWRCRSCRRQFSVLTGTVLQGTRTDLLTWLRVLVDQSDGNPAGAIADRFGLAPETVRHLLTRTAAAEQALLTGRADC